MYRQTIMLQYDFMKRLALVLLKVLTIITRDLHVLMPLKWNCIEKHKKLSKYEISMYDRTVQLIRKRGRRYLPPSNII